MDWMAWIANKHALLVHLPVAAALLIPLPIIAALRAGRGIRPWWTTCRYLAWAGVIGSVLALVSGIQLARMTGLLAPGSYWAAAGPGLAERFRFHEGAGLACLALSLACLRALYRHRQEHQGIGILALAPGLAWCVCAFASSYSGSFLGGVGSTQPAPASAPARALTFPVPASADPEAKAPVRVLDFASLKPMHLEPVKSPAHGNRGIRVWLSAPAAEAYRAGQPLPPGTLAVLSTVEDRWGRPGFEPGPLYALELAADGKPRFTFYWAQVPEARRGETAGSERAYWRDEHPALQACRACHAQGPAALKERSQWGIPRKPQPAA